MPWRTLGGSWLLALSCAGCGHVELGHQALHSIETNDPRHALQIDDAGEISSEWFEVARAACLSRGVWVDPPAGKTMFLPRAVRVSLGEESRPLGSFQGRPFEASDVPFLAMFAFDEDELLAPRTQRFQALVERLDIGRDAHAPLFRQETLDHFVRRAIASGLRRIPWNVAGYGGELRVLRVGLLVPESAQHPHELRERVEERLRLANTWLVRRLALRLDIVRTSTWPDADPGDLHERFQTFRRRIVPESCDLVVGIGFRREGQRDPHVGFASVFGQHLLMQMHDEPGPAEDLDVVREGTALLHELGHVFGLVHEPEGLMTAVRRELVVEPTPDSLELWRLMRDRPFPWNFTQASEHLDLDRIAVVYERWSGGDETQAATQAWFWKGSGHLPHAHDVARRELVEIADATHSGR
ncbi:MAG: hypothetical protein H6834_12580 [Planctomycetes bacterium]|nr:hypothetical protein [Planctomycetota bacterium]